MRQSPLQAVIAIALIAVSSAAFLLPNEKAPSKLDAAPPTAVRVGSAAPPNGAGEVDAASDGGTAARSIAKSTPIGPSTPASAWVGTRERGPVEEPIVRGRYANLPDEGARAALTRDIQRELRRVGCYSGEITGDWGMASKRAMRSLTDRVNAMLPVDDPDVVLLALVQSQKGSVCGVACPAAQVLTDDGRCVPRAALARANRAPPEPASRSDAAADVSSSWRAEQPQAPQDAATGQTDPLPGRMAVGVLPPATPSSEWASAPARPEPRRAALQQSSRDTARRAERRRWARTFFDNRTGMGR